ncbi:unnamed protein product [Urochloa humidicola]
MALDLNLAPPVDEEFLPDLNRVLALDLNIAPQDDDEVLPDLNNPLDDEAWHDVDGDEFAARQQLIIPVEGGEVLPDLNDHPANEEELFQTHDAQGISLGNDLHDDASEEELDEYGIYAGDLNINMDVEELEDSTDEEYEHANGNARTSRWTYHT